jgi:alpha-L-fucosidase
VSRDELLWEFTDVVAKGGNLLLNVGPRGVDASIPAEQSDRLSWLGEHVLLNREAIVATRPWVVSGAATPEGSDLRYTARGDAVFASLRGLRTRATLVDVRSTPLTRVDRLDGAALSWRNEPGGLVLEFGATEQNEGPIVVALRGVEAR